MIKDTKEKFRINTNNITNDNLNKNIQIITTNKPMLFEYKNNNEQLLAYENLDNKYNNIDILNMNSRNTTAFYSNKFSKYIFTKLNFNNQELETLYYSNDIKDILNKYKLNDIFIEDSYYNLDKKINKNELYSVISRILGSNMYENPIKYLNNKSFDIKEKNKYDSITNEEAVYLILKAYKNINNVDSITISNYNSISNKSEIDKKYLDSILIANELKLINIENEIYYPKEYMNLEKLLEILNNLLN